MHTFDFMDAAVSALLKHPILCVLGIVLADLKLQKHVSTLPSGRLFVVRLLLACSVWLLIGVVSVALRHHTLLWEGPLMVLSTFGLMLPLMALFQLPLVCIPLVLAVFVLVIPWKSRDCSYGRSILWAAILSLGALVLVALLLNLSGHLKSFGC